MLSNNYYRFMVWLFVSCTILLLSCHQRISGDLQESPHNMSKPEIITVARGSYCGIDSGMNRVIDSQNEFKKLWEKVFVNTQPIPPLPDVNFAEETVLAVFLGKRSTGGFGIEIDYIKKHEDCLTAIVKTTTPEPGEMVTMAISQPFHIAKVRSSGTDIVFKRK